MPAVSLSVIYDLTKPQDAHAMDASRVCTQLATDGSVGLSPAEAAERLLAVGPNRLAEEQRPSHLVLLGRQLASPMIGLLALAALVSVLVGEGIDALVIAAIVVVNAAIGYVQELRAEAAALSLRSLLAPVSRVVRGGTVAKVDAEQLIPGDIVVLRSGDRVPADGRILEALDLEIDESSLTGESLPDAKRAEPPVAADTILADRVTMTYAGTTVTNGAGRLAVTATGSHTEVGSAVAAGAAARPPSTPLERRFARLTAVLLRAIGALCLFLAVLAWAHGQGAADAARTGVALAVAAVPEGLPAVLTVALAIGVQRMARRNAIVRKLPAVETLGSTTVICTDKTGTLTEGRMSLGRVHAGAGNQIELATGRLGAPELELLGAATVASQQRPGALQMPDAADLAPTEAAITLAARRHLPDGIAESDGARVVRVDPFDSKRKRMSVIVDNARGTTAYVKGAPESLLPRLAASTATRDALAARAADWAEDGYRVLLVARRSIECPGDDPEAGLVPLGLLGLVDAVRERVGESIATARGAGVRTVLITGDHPGTALAIARATGIADADADAEVVTGRELDQLDDDELETKAASASIFARVAPEDKVRIVTALQRAGDVVAMTGDGVNDVPALEAADVGVAMGGQGTDAAREAADIVLADDNYSTIVAAIRRGRSIYENVVNFVHFLLAANAGEILVFTIAIAIGMPAPLTVVQILLVNLLTDGPPAVAIGVDPARSGLMDGPPRPASETILDPIRTELLLGGLLTGTAAFAAFAIGYGDGTATGRTMAFTTLIAAQLTYLFAVRARGWPPVAARNPFLYLAVAGAAAFAAILLVARFEAFRLVALDSDRIAIALCLATLPSLALLALKARRRRIVGGSRPGDR